MTGHCSNVEAIRILGLCIVVMACVWSMPNPARAQAEAQPPTPVPTSAPAPAPAPASTAPSEIELKAAAYDAQVAAQQATAAAEAAQKQAAEAQAALESIDAQAAPPPSPPPTVAVAPVPVPVPVPAPTPTVAAAVAVAPPAEPAVTQEDLQRAIEKAEQAASEARRAREELEAYKAKQKGRYARNGLTLSGGAFYAPQFFNTTAHVVSSSGWYGGIGYRVHPHFSIETNFNWVEGFTLDWAQSNGSEISFYNGDLTMWSATVGGKVYVLTNKIQPYVGFAVGATGGKGSFTRTGTEGFEFKEVAGTISFNTGIELYVSDSLAIGADAAIYLPGGYLGGLNYATLGGKLIYRF